MSLLTMSLLTLVSLLMRGNWVGYYDSGKIPLSIKMEKEDQIFLYKENYKDSREKRTKS